MLYIPFPPFPKLLQKLFGAEEVWLYADINMGTIF